MDSELVLDDRHPAIQYAAGVWFLGGGEGEYKATTMFTNTTGATVTVDFYGNSIRVVATLSSELITVATPEPLNLSFAVRSKFSTTNITSSTASFTQPSPPTKNAQLYESPLLNSGNPAEYQLVIRNLTPNNEGFLCLDALYIGGYAMGNNNSPPSAGTVSAISTITSPTSTSTQASSGADSKADGNQGLLIATGILGGLVGFVALGILAFFCKRQRDGRRKDAQAFSQSPHISYVAPNTHLPSTIEQSNHTNYQPTVLPMGQAYGGHGENMGSDTRGAESPPVTASAWSTSTVTAQSGFSRTSAQDGGRPLKGASRPPPYAS